MRVMYITVVPVVDAAAVVASLAAASVLDATVWAAMTVATLRMGTTAIPINAQYPMPVTLWFGVCIPIQFSIIRVRQLCNIFCGNKQPRYGRWRSVSRSFCAW